MTTMKISYLSKYCVCCYTDCSPASGYIVKTLCSCVMSVPTCKTTHCHNPEDLSMTL